MVSTPVLKSLFFFLFARDFVKELNELYIEMQYNKQTSQERSVVYTTNTEQGDTSWWINTVSNAERVGVLVEYKITNRQGSDIFS